MSIWKCRRGSQLEKRRPPVDARDGKSRQLMVNAAIKIRSLEEPDADALAAGFAEMGWKKPRSQYVRYLEEQAAGSRAVLVAVWDGSVAGYLTIVWESSEPVFRAQHIPEIKDFNVLARFRSRGIGSALMDRAEAMIAEKSAVAGLGVGLHSGYGSAQRLYARRGYIPDGAGVVIAGESVLEGAEVRLDDAPLLRMTKILR